MRHPSSSRRLPSARFALRPISLAACLIGAAPSVLAGPTGAVPTFGQTTVQQTSATRVDIVQTTQRAGIDWTSFSIAAGERVVVSQPGRSSVLLNRVLGNDPSYIFGSLESNGNVWLINPRGILFGATSRIDVGGLLASTLSISNEDVASGRLVLGRGAGTPGELRAEGRITAHDGSVILVAPQLTQSGTIDARRVGLAAATDVTVDVEGDGLIFFNLRNDGTLDTRLSLLGNVLADGGTAEVRAAARAGVVDTVLNLEGVVQARSIGQRNGRVVIDGGNDGITRLSGRVDVSGQHAGERGGDAVVLGDKVGLTSTAVVDASGQAGGGQIRIGGDYQGKNPDLHNAEMVVVQRGAALNADAGPAGDGGRVIVWSDEGTRFQGHLSARGGATGGDGGFAEVSGKNLLDFRGSVDMTAARGHGGTLLLDPKNLQIVEANPDIDGTAANNDLIASPLAFTDFAGVDSVITKGAVNALLAGAVELQATDNITVANSTTALSGTGSLTLRAGRDITVNGSITANAGITLSANDQAAAANKDGTGHVILAGDLSASAGTVSITNNPGGGTPGTVAHSLGGNITANSLSIAGNVTLTQSRTWTIGGTASVASNIAGTGFGLTKAGAGTLTLSGSNSYTGALNVTGGTLVLASNSAAGTTAGGIGVSGGTLDIQATIGAEALTFNSGAIGTSTGSASYAGAITLAADMPVTVGGGASLELSGAIGGVGQTLSKAGAGTLLLSNAANTYGGAATDTTVSAGTLAVTASAVLGGGNLVLDGGTLKLQSGITFAKDITLGAGGGTIDNNATTSSLSGAIDGAALVVGGGGVLTLANAGNSHASTTVGSSTTLAVASAGALGTALTLDGGTLRTTAAITTGKAVTLGAGGGTVDSNSFDSTLSGVIDGAGALTKAGSGTLLLSGTNTYDGLTTVGAGTLAIGSAAGLGSVTGGTLLSGGTLDIRGVAITGEALAANSGTLAASTGNGSFDGTVTLAAALNTNVGSGAQLTLSGQLTGNFDLNKAGTGTLVLSNATNDYGSGASHTTVTAGTLAVSDSAALGDGDLVLNGGSLKLQASQAFTKDITLAAASSIDVNATTSSIDGAIGGAQALTLTGGGTITLSDTGNAQSSTVVNGGTTLAIGNNAGVLGSGGLTLANATLQTTAGLTTSKTLALGTGGGTIDSNGFTSAFNGVVSGTALTITDTGTVTLGNSANTHSGTTVSGGATLVAGSAGALGTALTLDGGTLRTSAAITTGKAVTLGAAGGTINSNGFDSTLSGTIDGAGALTKSGSGILLLSGTNSYDGSTTIGAGTLAVSNASGLGSTTGGTVLNAGTLDIRGAAIAGEALTVNGGNLNASTGSGSFGGAITLAADLATNIGATASLALTGGIGGVGFGLSKAGAGTLVIGGTNTYTGAVTLDAGTLALTSASALGTVASDTTVNGGTLDIRAAIGAEAMTFNGGTLATSTGSGSYAGAIALTSNLAVDVGTGADLTLSGQITSANRGLDKAGAGTLVLSNTTNSYGNAGSHTTVTAGTLAVADSAVLGSGDLVLNGGSLRLQGNQTFAKDITLSAAGSIDNNATTSTVGGHITGNNVLTLTGGGTITLSDATNAQGSTTVNGGTTLAIGNDDGVLGNGGLTLANATLQTTAALTSTKTLALGSGGGTIDSNGFASTFSGVVSGANTLTITDSTANTGVVRLSGANTHSGTTVSGGATLAAGAASALGTTLTLDDGTLQASGSFTNTKATSLGSGGGTIDTGSNSVVFSGIASGTGTLNKAGSGTLTLSGANTYSGITTVNAGTLAVGHASGLGATGNGTVLNAGTLDIVGVTVGAETLTVAGGTLAASSGSGSYNGAITLNGALAVNVAGTQLTLGGNIGGAAGFTKAGSGTLVVSGTNNYDGAVTLSAGTLALTSASALGSTAGDTTVNGGTLDIRAAIGAEALTVNSGTLATSTGSGSHAGTVALAGSTAVDVGSAATLTLSGVVSGPAALTKSGAGALVLSAANSYTGDTTIAAGSLRLNGATAAVGGTIHIGNNTRLDIDNGATVANTIDVGTGVTIGNTVGSGTLAGPNTLALANGSTLTLASSGAGLVVDRAIVDNAGSAGVAVSSGTVTMTGAGGYDGGTGVANGATLKVGGSGVAGTGTITLTSGATLDIVDAATVANALVSNGGTLANSSGLGTLDGSSTFTLGAASTLSSTVTGINTGLTVQRALTGAFGITKAGAGSVTLTADNLDGGTTTIAAGTLRILRSDDVTLAGTITGAGSFEQAGSGKTTLTGANSYGNTVVSGGILDVGTGGTLGTGPIDVATVLRFSSSANVVVPGGISGTGSLEQAGSGILTVNGNGNYSGGTTVSAGTLSIDGASAHAGSGAIGIAAGATLDIANGAVVDNAVSSAGGRIANSAGLGTLDASNVLTLTGDTTLASTGGGLTVARSIVDNAGTFGITTQGGVTLGGASSFDGAVNASSGTLTLSGTLASTTVNVAGGATLLLPVGAEHLADGTTLATATGSTLTVDNTETITTLNAGATVNGSGTLVASNYNLAGATIGANLGAGTLSSTGSSSINAAVAAGSVTVASGTLAVGSAGALDDTAAVVVQNGATLTLAVADTVGSLALNGGTLAGAGRLTAATYALNGGTISGLVGAGALTSTGSSTISGSADTTTLQVSGGTLTTSAADRIGNGTAVTVDTGAVLALGGSETVGSLSLSGTLNGGPLTATTYALAGGTVNGDLGAGTLTSSGSSTLNGHSAASTIAVSGGTLALGSAGRFTAATPAVDVAGGAILALGGNETFGTLTGLGEVQLGSATLTTGSGGDATFDGVLSGLGGLTKVGSSTVTLAGASSYSGATQVSAGTLALASAERLPNVSDVTVDSGATLHLNGNETVASLTLAGTLDGTGTLLAGTTTLNGGTVNTDLGGGALVITANSTLSSASSATSIVINGGTLTLLGADRLSDTASVTIGGSGALRVTVDETIGDLSVAGLLTGAGTLTASTVHLQGGTVNANLGSGALFSSGNSTLNGSSAASTLQVDGGTLALGSAGRFTALPAVTVASGANLNLGGNETFGSLAGAGNVALGAATLATGSGGDSTFSGALGGSGALVKQGTGTFTLAGANTYSGSTTVQAGTLAVAGTLASTTLAVDAGTLVLQSAERLADAANVTVANGATFTLAGNETINSLQLAGTLGGSGTLNAASTALNGGTVNADLGAGTLASSGGSTLNGQAASSTVDVTGGTLTLGSGGRFTATPALTVATGAVLALGGNETIGALTGGGAVQLGSATLTAGGSGNSTFGGVIGGAGALVKQGSGRFTLAGDNVFTGGTTVQAGTLQLAGGNTLADGGAVTVATGATLALTSSETVGSLALSGQVNGSGTLGAATVTLDGGTVDTQLASSTLVSTGNSRLNGVATVGSLAVDGGTLTLGSAGRLAAAPVTTVAANATLALGGNETLGTLAGSGTVDVGTATLATGSAGSSTFDGAITGSGNLVKQGSGSFTLAGANSYSGTTQVDAGTLALSSADRLADASAVTVASGATLALAGNDTVASLVLRGTLAGSGTLTAANYLLDSGTANANLGAGSLVSTGTSTLAGSSAAGSVAVNGGTLQLAAANRLADNAGVTVANGATLALNGNDQVASVQLQGTLGGNGRLTAASYTLAGGTVNADLGAGTLTSSGNSTLNGNAAVDNLTVSAGTLQLGGASRLTAAPTTTVDAGATLALGGNETLGRLAGSGNVNLGTATLATGSTGDSTFAGVLAGTGGLTKQGAASNFTLSGDSTYTGLTRVDGGTLTVGDGGTNGSIASNNVVVDGTLRSARSDNVVFAQNISGNGGVEQIGSGRLTLQGGAASKTYLGATHVAAGELATAGADQLPDASDVRVDTGARLLLGGNETVHSVTAAGDVVLGGNLSTPQGAMLLTGAVTAAGDVTLTGQQIDAVNDGNHFSGSVAIDAGGVLTFASGRDNNGQRRDLLLGNVRSAAGGTVSAGIVTLRGDVTVSGGTLALVSSAPATVTAPDTALLGKITPAQRQIAFAGDVVQQDLASGGRIDVAAGAGLQVVAENGGSVQLLGANNRFAGELAVRSGAAVSPWAGNVVSATFGGTTQEYSMQSHVQINGTTVRIGGAGIEADVVAIRADTLSTAPGAVIAARLPFDNLAGTTNALPALTLELSATAFTLNFPFGQTNGNEIAINVGSRAWGNRTTVPIDGGYITVLPRNGAQGSTAVVLVGPQVVGSYAFFFDGAGLQSEIPVFYNGVLPVTPQVSGSISATVAVSEGARKERFDDAVRTENVAVRLRSGVIAEVGPGRPATVGSEGARAPAGCSPAGATLACEGP